MKVVCLSCVITACHGIIPDFHLDQRASLEQEQEQWFNSVTDKEREMELKLETEWELKNETKKMTIFHNAVVNHEGYIFENGELKEVRFEGCMGYFGRYLNRDGGRPSWAAAPTVTPYPEDRKLDTVVIIASFWDNYYHLVVEGIHRLGYVNVLQPDLLKTAFFHLGSVEVTPTSYGVGWMELFGIPMDRVIGRQQVVANTAIWPPTHVGCEKPVGSQMEAHKLLLQVAGLPDERIPKLNNNQRKTAVLVKRTASRVLTNHDDVVSTLNTNGYDVIVLRDDPAPAVSEQCRMFREADLIIGPHGAAFSNLVCARTGTDFIEFTMKEPIVYFFKFIAEELKLNHIPINTNLTHDNSADAPIPDLDATLKKLAEVVF